MNSTSHMVLLSDNPTLRSQIEVLYGSWQEKDSNHFRHYEKSPEGVSSPTYSLSTDRWEKTPRMCMGLPFFTSLDRSRDFVAATWRGNKLRQKAKVDQVLASQSVLQCRELWNNEKKDITEREPTSPCYWRRLSKMYMHQRRLKAIAKTYKIQHQCRQTNRCRGRVGSETENLRMQSINGTVSVRWKNVMGVSKYHRRKVHWCTQHNRRSDVARWKRENQATNKQHKQQKTVTPQKANTPKHQTITGNPRKGEMLRQSRQSRQGVLPQAC